MTPLRPTCVLAVDTVILTVADGRLRVLVQERRHAPFAGRPALPGVLVLDGETEDAAVGRALTTKANGAGVYLSQVATFTAPDRDPRGRVVSLVWGALVAREVSESLSLGGVSLATVSRDGTQVLGPDGAPLRLAFDHGEMVVATVRWLRARLRNDLTGAEMLGREFSLRELRAVYEAVYGRDIPPSNFQAFVLNNGLAVPTGRKAEACGRGRPSALYTAATRPASPLED